MKTYMIWDSHGWVQRDLPATDRNGESSSPDVPAGTGGTKVRNPRTHSLTHSLVYRTKESAGNCNRVGRSFRADTHGRIWREMPPNSCLKSTGLYQDRLVWNCCRLISKFVDIFKSHPSLHGRLGSRVVSVLDSGAEGPGFK